MKIPYVSIFLICAPFLNYANDSEADKQRPPIELTANVINSNTVKLSWIGMQKDVSYNMRIRPVGVLTWTNYTIQAPTCTRRINDLVAGTTYQWQVQTQFSSRIRDTSIYVNGKTFTAWEPCEMPQNLSAVVNDPMNVMLSWSGPTENIRYSVRLREKNETTWVVYETANTSVLIDNLNPNAEYDWNVKALCTNSDMTSETSETTGFNSSDENIIAENSAMLTGITQESQNRLVTFNSEASNSYPVEAKLVDCVGKNVESLKVYYTASNGTVAFDLSDQLAPGLYNISYRCGTDVQSQTVMIGEFTNP
jgi:hypothetical protein